MDTLQKRYKHGFTTVNNDIFRSKQLSAKAIGILCLLFSLPDNWEFSVKGIKALFPFDGRDSIQKGIMELEEKGFLTREQTRVNGKLAGSVWTVCDSPLTDFPSTEKPSAENPPQLNTNRIKDLKNKDISKGSEVPSNTERSKPFAPPTVEEVAAYCVSRQNKIDAVRFVDFYAAKGWYIGKNKMKDWKAAVRTWEHGSKTESKKQEVNWLE
jgi:hypothetical protein